MDPLWCIGFGIWILIVIIVLYTSWKERMSDSIPEPDRKDKDQRGDI